MENVTKTQLREFVDSKISKRKKELRHEITGIVTERLGASLTNLLGDMKELEKVANKFEDLLSAKIHLLGGNCVPSYAPITASNAGKLCNPHKYFLEEIVNKAISALTHSGYRFNCEPLMDEFNKLSSELQPQIKLLTSGLDTLKSELNNAISVEPTGKRGYNALVALGVDMSDMPEVNPNLPAIVKLSVDVCALNGNCNEKVV